MALRFIPVVLLGLSACSSPVTVEPVLQIVSISPSGGAANVNVDSNILTTFNAELDTESLNTEDAYLLDVNGEIVLTDLLYAPERWTLTLDPVGDLEKASEYTLVLTTSIQSKAKGALLQEVRSSFTTTGEDPQNAKPVADPGESQFFLLGGEECCVNLTGAASYDPEGAPLTYTWSLDSQPTGSTASLSASDTIDTEFSPDEEGDYLIRLVVNDGLFDSDPTYVTVSASTTPQPGDDTGDTGDTTPGDTGDTDPEDTGSSDTGS